MRKTKKKTPILDKAIQWGEDRSINDVGLCNSLPYFKNVKTLKLFMPSLDDHAILRKQDMSTTYWASGLKYYDNGIYRDFTPLRQTIVAFLIVMNEEV